MNHVVFHMWLDLESSVEPIKFRLENDCVEKVRNRPLILSIEAHHQFRNTGKPPLRPEGLQQRSAGDSAAEDCCNFKPACLRIIACLGDSECHLVASEHLKRKCHTRGRAIYSAYMYMSSSPSCCMSHVVQSL